MALTLKWSKHADHKFDQILEYLEKEWGANVNKAFVKRTYEFLDIIVEFPEIGSLENVIFLVVQQLHAVQPI